MVDQSTEALFREIEEDLRRDRMAALWKRYGRWVITLAVAIVLTVAGREGWRWWEQRQAEAASQQYLAALELAASDPERAQAALRTLVTDGPRGYALLARLREAALYAQHGNLQAAAAIYREVETIAPRPAFRDLAVILGGYVSLATAPTPEAVDALYDKLKPLAAPASPWRFSARELIAAIELQRGNENRARELLAELAADEQAPADLRARAQMAATQLGSS